MVSPPFRKILYETLIQTCTVLEKIGCVPIKMASGVQDITCVFVEVAVSYKKKKVNLTVSWDGV